MNTPKIRFKGYTDAWEQRKLSDVANYKKGFAFKSEDYTDEGIKIIRVSDLDYNSIKKEGQVCISEDSFETYKDWSLQRNDLIITTVGSKPPVWDSLVGKVVAVPDEFSGSLLNQNAIRVRCKAGNSQLFLKCIFSKNYIDYLQTIIRGNANQGSITVEELFKYNFAICTYEEQTKIGLFFRNLDNLITLHQRKCDSLKQVKKYMLQKMFPQNGAKVPEIRFKGFTGDWEKRKLDSLCDLFTDGDWIESKDQSVDGVRLIQTGNVGTTEYVDKENSKKWISEDTFDRLRCEEVFPGDILISRLPEPAGRACIMPDIGTRMITAVDCTIVRTSKNCNNKYLVQYLSTPEYFKKVNSFLGGGTRQRISRGNLSEIQVPMPQDIGEQIKIGEYLTNLDSLIALHQRKADSLKELKKFMLQNMFP